MRTLSCQLYAALEISFKVACENSAVERREGGRRVDPLVSVLVEYDEREFFDRETRTVSQSSLNRLERGQIVWTKVSVEVNIPKLCDG